MDPTDALPNRAKDAQKKFLELGDDQQSLVETMIEPPNGRRLTAVEFADMTSIERGLEVNGGSGLRKAIESAADKRGEKAQELIEKIRNRPKP